MARAKLSVFERLHKGQLNRGERRKLAQKVASADPGLSIVNPNAAGIDIGNGSHFVAVPPDRDPHPVREFGGWTAALKEAAQWLVSCGIDTVAMQSTGVYWIPLYDMLEQHGLRVVLCNARDAKNLPGRKTDVQECQWLMKLHTYGLLRDSFRLPQAIEAVRTVWRIRGRLVQDAVRAVQHMQKALTKMNVQLANAISDLSGVTGQAILRAILEGERDPYKLADRSDPHIQASREEIAHSLEGNWRGDILFELQIAVDDYQFAHRQMEQCDRQLQSYLAALPSRVLEPPEASPAGQPAGKKNKQVGNQKDRRKLRKGSANAPQWDVREELERVCGVDLTTLDGINVIGALTIISEVGTDLSAFPNEDHFASWLGLTGNHNSSGGKPVKGPKRKVKNRVAEVLRMGASGLLGSDSYLGARYRQFRRTAKTEAAAVKAMARHLAVLVYRLMTKGKAWVDQGAVVYEQKRKQRERAALEKRAREQGFQLVPVAAVN